MKKLYNMSTAEREKLGKKGRAHVKKNYNFEGFSERWVEVIDRVHEECGSWATRKNYESWTLREVA